MSARADFSQSTKDLLARRAGYRCSICQNPTIGPHSNENSSLYLGEASHIYAAAPSGPRANPSLTPEQLVVVTNGIHLCKVHARAIDMDVKAYPAERLHEIKKDHEAQIRSQFVGSSKNYDPDFLSSHETQVNHGRGNPNLNDLWTDRNLVQPQIGGLPKKKDALSLLSTETGICIISGDESSGRTCLLKRMASTSLSKKSCIWLDGKEITVTTTKDPLPALGAGYERINFALENWENFLSAEPCDNLILIDNLHLSSLNLATRRKFLLLLQGLAGLVVVTANDPFVMEILSASANDGFLMSHWQLSGLTRANCVHIVDRWCRFGSETIEDDKLDSRIAQTNEHLEMLFGRKLVPRYPVSVLTTLQHIEARMPLDTNVGSLGGIYETIIHMAINKGSKSAIEVGSQRAYLQELAFFGEADTAAIKTRVEFNEYFSKLKAISQSKTEELELELLQKNFLSRSHYGFRFNYQKHYFLAAFIRDNPNRNGVKEFISKLIKNSSNEDYANTALFLAYLQPSTHLIEVLLNEVCQLFASIDKFDIAKWNIPSPFPQGFFRNLQFSKDPAANRRLLAEHIDESSPTDSAECKVSAQKAEQGEEEVTYLNYLKSYHLIKLVGQLIRNSPIALDGDQKSALVNEGFNLSFRVITLLNKMLSTAALQADALNTIEDKVLKQSDRAKIEAALAGLVYHIRIFTVHIPLRHACFYLANPELEITYNEVLGFKTPKNQTPSQKTLACGINFALRSPNVDLLRSTYHNLPEAGQDLMRIWTSIYLSFNQVAVTKRQAMLESVEMTSSIQLLLPKGS
jgi:hypothetical protein